MTGVDLLDSDMSIASEFQPIWQSPNLPVLDQYELDPHVYLVTCLGHRDISIYLLQLAHSLQRLYTVR